MAHLPACADEDAVVAQALRRSVGLYGMAPFRATRGAAPPQLVLGFGLVNERAIETGIAAVADLLQLTGLGAGSAQPRSAEPARRGPEPVPRGLGLGQRD